MRIDYIDKLKGFAIMLVVMGHVTEKSLYINDSSFSMFYGSFHMALFMFLSGLFVNKGMKQWDRLEICLFLKKKVLRILLPFFIVGGLYSWITYRDLSVIYPGNGGYWFLPALFLCMLTEIAVGGAFFRILSNRNSLLTDVFLHLAVWGLLCVVNYLLNPPIPYYLFFIKHYPFFAFGVLCKRYLVVYTAITTSKTLMALACIIYMFMLPYLHDFPLKFTGFFAIVICMQIFYWYYAKIPDVMITIGRSSLAIYVFHWFMLPSNLSIGKMLMSAPGPFEELNNGNFILIACISLAISIPIILSCMMLETVIKHSKWLNLIVFGSKKQ